MWRSGRIGSEEDGKGGDEEEGKHGGDEDPIGEQVPEAAVW